MKNAEGIFSPELLQGGSSGFKNQQESNVMILKTSHVMGGNRESKISHPSAHLREFLVFVRETVHSVVEHFLHQTFLIIWNTETVHLLTTSSHSCSENALNISFKPFFFTSRNCASQLLIHTDNLG